MSDADLPPEIAYYYPEPYWLTREGGWIKSLLLFFDQVAILLPEYMYGRHVLADPTLAEPLEDQGLLRILQPEWFVDEETTGQLTDVVGSLIEAGSFEDLPDMGPLAKLSMSRMGYAAVEDVAHQVYVRLEAAGRCCSCGGPGLASLPGSSRSRTHALGVMRSWGWVGGCCVSGVAARPRICSLCPGGGSRLDSNRGGLDYLAWWSLSSMAEASRWVDAAGRREERRR